MNAATVGAVETPLHLVCSFSPKKHSADVMSGMARIAEALLKTGANPNMQNSKGRLVTWRSIYECIWIEKGTTMQEYDGSSGFSSVFIRTPLHEAVSSGNEPVFNQLLQCKQ